ncbi:hypothetical protein LIS66_19970 [Pseudomonas sp. HN2]|uniref:hypothetical protein n=1 Tax=Pseudomonas sp. HN2 TaxID=2884805 RepID=UPI001D149B0C|nr:hypothetical protein [Pseudomonas sp. HN2]UEB94639.1 hypothetical protein LIS66_19970 [Pseudomonas sp. HN2]
MAKLEDFREGYYVHSGKVSDNVRSLCISAVAIIWVFKQDANQVTNLPVPLYWALLWVVAALAFDFAQYFYASSAWGIFTRIQERRNVADDTELDAPPILNWPSIMFFYLKSFSAVMVYVQIFRHLYAVVRPI